MHPVVNYYRIDKDEVRELHIFLSDDIKHDHRAVNEFTLRSLSIVQKKTRISKLTMWSDGAALFLDIYNFISPGINYASYLSVLKQLWKKVFFLLHGLIVKIN